MHKTLYARDRKRVEKKNLKRIIMATTKHEFNQQFKYKQYILQYNQNVY